MQNIKNIIENAGYESQFCYSDFKNALTEENRIRFDALKVKGLDANLVTDYGKWKILAWDGYMDYDDESRYSGEYEITDKDNYSLNRAMEKAMDEFEKHIGEDWAGTEKEIIEGIAYKYVDDYAESFYDEDDMMYAISDAKLSLNCAMERIKSLSKDGDCESLYLLLSYLLDDETKKRYEAFKTFVISRQQIKVEDCGYIPVRDFVEAKAKKLKVYDVCGESKLATFLTVYSEANPKPHISVEIEDPISIRSVTIAFNKMVNNAMDFYDEMRDMYRSYCAERLKK